MTRPRADPHSLCLPRHSRWTSGKKKAVEGLRRRKARKTRNRKKNGEIDQGRRKVDPIGGGRAQVGQKRSRRGTGYTGILQPTGSQNF